MGKSTLLFLCGSLLCATPRVVCQDKGMQHTRIGLRYTAPKGIGYQQRYATLEGFLAPQGFLGGAWLPFLDMRGHILNNGKIAANTGLGMRYVADRRIWGGNVYYDYRRSYQNNYNQIAAGFETLGRIWDFRINGYLPVLRGGPSFFAMRGASAEAGFHLEHFYFAGGPYYLKGMSKSSWGGELRGTVDLFYRYLRIEGSGSYDNFFSWIAQAQVKINIPFGGKNSLKERKARLRTSAITLEKRAAQPVDRFEIIPLAKNSN